MCQDNSANRLCGSSPPLRSDGTAWICHLTAFAMLEHFVDNHYTPDNVKTRLLGNDAAFHAMLRATGLDAVYAAADDQLRGLICAEVDERMTWASGIHDPADPGTALLQQVQPQWQTGTMTGGGGISAWAWDPAAKHNYDRLLYWFILGMEGDRITRRKKKKK